MAHYSKDPEENISDYQYTLCAVEPGTNDCGSGNAFFPVDPNVVSQLESCKGKDECKVDIVWVNDATTYMVKYDLYNPFGDGNSCITSSWEWNISKGEGANKVDITSSELLNVKMEDKPKVCEQ